MRVHFIGIGGTAIGPLALIAKQAGYQVSGTDKQESSYIDYLKSQGIENIDIGSDNDFLSTLHKKDPVDLIVYSSAIAIENPDHPEIRFGRDNGIKTAKRDELLNKIIKKNGLKLVAVAGTHGKTTTTAMLIWLLKQLGIPISYSVGAKISFGDMGHFDKDSEYFIYECDEFDRNFLAFYPYLSLITGIDHDHHEQYPTAEDYRNAFKQFLVQSKHKIIWQKDVDSNSITINDSYLIVNSQEHSENILNKLSVPGSVNRQDAALAIAAASKISDESTEKMVQIMNGFPGVSRRFEKITDNLYSDYAHTIPKIKGCLQLAGEISNNVVVVYEPLTNRRQYYVKDEYKHLFKGVKKLYWVPSYLAREDPDQKVISPQEFIDSIKAPDDKSAAELDTGLKQAIEDHLTDGDLIVCLSGGGGNSLDEWLRKEFKDQ